VSVQIEIELAGFEFENVKLFENILKAISAVNTEVPIQFDLNQLVIKCMDPCHIMLVSATIEKYAFTEYWLKTEEPQKFMINLENVLKFFKHVDKNYSVRFVLDKIGQKGLTITFSSYLQKKKSFMTDTYEVSGELYMPKNLEFTAYINVDIEPLIEAVKDIIHSLNAYELSLSIDSLGRKFTISSTWDNTDYNMELRSSDKTVHNMDNYSPEEVKVKLDANYLHKILNAIKPISSTVRIDMATNKPIKITIPELSTIDMYFLQAPRL